MAVEDGCGCGMRGRDVGGCTRETKRCGRVGRRRRGMGGSRRCGCEAHVQKGSVHTRTVEENADSVYMSGVVEEFVSCAGLVPSFAGMFCHSVIVHVSMLWFGGVLPRMNKWVLVECHTSLT